MRNATLMCKETGSRSSFSVFLGQIFCSRTLAPGDQFAIQFLYPFAKTHVTSKHIWQKSVLFCRYILNKNEILYCGLSAFVRGENKGGRKWAEPWLICTNQPIIYKRFFLKPLRFYPLQGVVHGSEPFCFSLDGDVAVLSPFSLCFGKWQFGGDTSLVCEN